MFRLPVSGKRIMHLRTWTRCKSSSNFIRSTFIEYFEGNHGHKHIKSSSVVPLYDSSVPFVNAGMNQFKSVFLGKVDPPCPRAVNSQKCVRVGGKHNDLDVVGTDGHHHTFFEMLGNWSFGDYYKQEACEMAWNLLLGPYGLKPENLVVTYFQGDAVMDLREDVECRDIWRKIGVQESRLRALTAKDNFWEMGATGPCGPCTEIHYVHADGSLTEIWNLVFIQFDRDVNGKVHPLRRSHVDTGMGLERMAALLQGVSSNYDTDLFAPIIRAIEKNSIGVDGYHGRFGSDQQATLDAAYRRLADHARMISVCLADGVFPATSLNLKQILRKTLKISTDIFKNPNLLPILYDQVALSLGETYPELSQREKDAIMILEHETNAYAKMRANLNKRWKDLAKQYPEVEALSDIELAGFATGYKEFKETMAKQTTNTVPGDLVFKLYDTHGFQEDVIQRIASLNGLEIDRQGFWKLLSEHKARHKTALKEKSDNRGRLFNKCIERLINEEKFQATNDQYKYDYLVNSGVEFKPLRTRIIAILNDELEWLDFLEPNNKWNYYIVTQDTNFYCEEGGQISDTGVIRINKDVKFNVESAFKIRGFVFHKGCFSVVPFCDTYVNRELKVTLEINQERRLNTMRNHTAVHLLNAAVRKMLPNSVVCQIGSSVTDRGLYLNLSVYGEKLSQKVVLDAQELVRQSIQSNCSVQTSIIDSVQLSQQQDVLMIPGERYPETGLRLISAGQPLVSKELCCGTHVPWTGELGDFCVTLVKGAGGHTPTIHALTGESAKEARELFCRAQKLEQVIDLIDPERKQQEISTIKRHLVDICGSGGAPYGEYAQCLALLDRLQKREDIKNDIALQAVAEEEIREASLAAEKQGHRFIVHFLRCSYLMQSEGVTKVLAACSAPGPALVIGCAGGVVVASCRVPKELVSPAFDARRWLNCALPAFDSKLTPTADSTHAMMTATKVSLITCEQQVQDAMRAAITFAQTHAQPTPSRADERACHAAGDSGAAKGRRQN